MSEFEKDKPRDRADENDDFDLSMDDEVVTDEMLGYSELDDEFQALDAEMEGDISSIDSELDNDFMEIGGDDSDAELAPSPADSSPDALDQADAPAAPYFAYFKPAFIAGLIIYSAYLLFAKAPAELAAWAAHKAVPQLWFSSVQGSLWKGSAGSAQLDIGNKALALGQVDWSLDPLSILLLKPCIHFASRLPNQSIAGRVCQSPFGVTSVNDLVAELPIAALNELLPVDASGQLSLNILSAQTNGQSFSQMDARFSWANARVSAENNIFVLGSFGGEMQSDESGGLRANVFDIDGPFSVKGNAAWNPSDKVWKLEGTIIPKPDAPDPVVQALQVIGEDVGGGAYKIVWP